MCDGRSTEPRDRLDLVSTRDEVDCDRILLAGHGEGRGLSGLPDQLFEMRARHPSHVEAGEQCVREVDDPEAKAIPASRRHSLDEIRGCERPELAGHGARCHPGSPRDLVRAELTGFGERVENGERSFRCADSACRRLTRARHGYTVVADPGTALLIVQFMRCRSSCPVRTVGRVPLTNSPTSVRSRRDRRRRRRCAS